MVLRADDRSLAGAAHWRTGPPQGARGSRLSF